jgi:hypothetical protein
LEDACGPTNDLRRKINVSAMKVRVVAGPRTVANKLRRTKKKYFKALNGEHKCLRMKMLFC